MFRFFGRGIRVQEGEEEDGRRETDFKGSDCETAKIL